MKFQLKITLADSEVILSEVSDDAEEKDKVEVLSLLECAAKDDLNYMKFTRVNGNIIIISKHSLRTAKYFEFVEVK